MQVFCPPVTFPDYPLDWGRSGSKHLDLPRKSPKMGKVGLETPGPAPKNPEIGEGRARNTWTCPENAPKWGRSQMKDWRGTVHAVRHLRTARTL